MRFSMRTGFNRPADNAGVVLQFSSDPALIPGVCDACSNYATEYQPTVAPKVSIVLRELLCNALEHGNRNDTGRMITCRVTRLDHHKVEIAVEDEGAGFDSATLDLAVGHEPAMGWSRGLKLVNTLSDRLTFEAEGRRVVSTLSWNSAQSSVGHF